MEQTLKKFDTFIQNIKENTYVLTSDMESDPDNYRRKKTVSARLGKLEIENFENKLKFNKSLKSEDFIVEDIEEDYKVKLTEEQRLILYLPKKIEWTREEQKENEGILSGGCFFNGILDIFSFEPTFFEYSLNKFLQYEDEAKTDVELIRKLRFIESPTSLQDATYTPYFGCVMLKENEFPTDFYFYDSGLVYKLPFKSYAEYIDALIQSSAVNCWQYFYIDPQEIIAKNKGISYITWGLHTRTRLDEDLAGLNFVPDAKYDRLDLINEHLKQCVELLPSTFPFLTFEHHINYYTQFKKLYEASI